MPHRTDFELVRYSDGQLVDGMSPPTPIGGWQLEFRLLTRPQATSGLIIKSAASGYSAVSGITITNSGTGEFQVTLNSVDTSGRDPGVYWYTMDRLQSGARSRLTEGQLTLLA